VNCGGKCVFCLACQKCQKRVFEIKWQTGTKSVNNITEKWLATLILKIFFFKWIHFFSVR